MGIYATDEDSKRYQEACDWFVRLRESAEDSSLVTEWLAWCAGDARNREAFERVREDWVTLGTGPHAGGEKALSASESLPSTAVTGRRPPVSVRRSILLKAAGVAALALCLGTGWLLWNPMGTDTVARLSTTPTEHRSLRLTDGSQVELAGDSLLEVRMYPHRRDLVLVRGEAYFSVAHDPARPFIVRAGSLDVRAVGTRFDVRTADSRVVVAVEEGVVVVEPPDGTAATVNALLTRLKSTGKTPLRATPVRSGQEVAVVPDQEVQMLPIEPTAVASWRAGRLRFAREPLKSVLESIRAVSGEDIELADPGIADLRFTGTVFSSGVHAWVMALPAVFPVTVRQDGAKLVISHRVEPQN